MLSSRILLAILFGGHLMAHVRCLCPGNGTSTLSYDNGYLTDQKWADQLLTRGYDPRIRPNQEHGTTVVNLSITVNNLIESDNIEQSFNVDLLVSESWNDERINFQTFCGRDRVHLFDTAAIYRFWMPDSIVLDKLNVHTVEALAPMEKVTIEANGRFTRTRRIDARVRCYMNLQNFPHDHQYCRVKWTSLTYTKKELTYLWEKWHVHTRDFPIFKINWWYSNECLDWHTDRPEASCLVGTVKMVRHLSYYIIRHYLLTFWNVITAYVGFWLPVCAYPGRIIIQTTQLLGLISHDISIQNRILVNYVVSFHWWMMWLEGFVFLGISEYAMALHWTYFINEKKALAKMVEEAEREGKPKPVPEYIVGYYFGNKGWYNRAGRFIDRILFTIFGPTDLHRDPYFRNKIDYCARTIAPTVVVTFVFIYSMCCFVPWSTNYYHPG